LKKKERDAIVYDMAEVFFTLVIFAVIFITVGGVVVFFQNWQQQNFASGVFDTSVGPPYLQFITQYWIWLPAAVVFACAVYGFMRALKRTDTD
jgi:hypothetical protein